MSNRPIDPIFGAAVLKLSMAKKGLITDPGFRVVYAGTLRELGIKDSAVEAYIAKNRELLEKHIEANRPKG